MQPTQYEKKRTLPSKIQKRKKATTIKKVQKKKPAATTTGRKEKNS